VIDWVAPTVEEALIMVRTAVDMAKGRKGIYQQRMAAVDDDKLPIDAEVPGIVIVLDEGAEAVAANRGNQDLRVELEKLVSIARASRFNLVLSGLRGTAEIIPPALKAQAGVKIWMRPEDPHEVAQLLSWSGAAGISIEDAPWPGSGLMRAPGQPGITPYRGFQLRPAQIRDIAIACQNTRPVLDLPTARIGGSAYARRWDRYRAWHQTTGGVINMTSNNTPNTGGNPSNEGPQDRPQGVAGLAGAAGDLNASLERLREVRERAEQNNKPADVDAAFAAIVGAEKWGDDGSSDSAGDDGDQAAEPQQRMLTILRGAGATGMHWETLQAALAKVGISKSKPTIYRWLRVAAEAGKVAQVEGQDGRWAATSD
jgi:hypothetical protein